MAFLIFESCHSEEAFVATEESSILWKRCFATLSMTIIEFLEGKVMKMRMKSLANWKISLYFNCKFLVQYF